MGLALSSLDHWWNGPKNFRIVMIGLDGAGKTTILYKLKLGEIVTTIPTIGFNVETVTYRKLSFTVWDVGGQGAIRMLWHYYYDNSDAIIFVIDSSDRSRIPSVKEEIEAAMSNDKLRNVKLLIYANKQDMPNALSTSELSAQLDLTRIVTQESYFMQPTNATTGEGLMEGLDWLHNQLK